MRASTSLRALGLLAALAATGGAAMAADLGAAPLAPSFTTVPSARFEVRGGVFAHDPWSPEQGSADLNVEALSPRLFSTGSAWDVLIPRAHVGGTINFNGKTSHGYAGLTWTYDVTQQIFVEASFGGAVHNGKTGRIVPVNFNALGCSPLFRESASIGYRLNQSWSVMASVEHLSNAGLCSNNRGLTNAGVRLGYSF